MAALKAYCKPNMWHNKFRYYDFPKKKKKNLRKFSNSLAINYLCIQIVLRFG